MALLWRAAAQFGLAPQPRAAYSQNCHGHIQRRDLSLSLSLSLCVQRVLKGFQNFFVFLVFLHCRISHNVLTTKIASSLIDLRFLINLIM